MLQKRAVAFVFTVLFCGRRASAFRSISFPVTAEAIPSGANGTPNSSALCMEKYDGFSNHQETSPEQLLEKARILREEIAANQEVPVTSAAGIASEQTTRVQNALPWSLQSLENDATVYRLYVDVGREEGTWMEPRFGASGQRIEFTLDVCFTTQAASRNVAEQIVKDNRGASSSPVYCLDTAPFARLRGGFDRMKCQPGAYRVDTSANMGQKVLRLFFHAEGKKSADVYVAQDSNIYISLPVLADSSISRKEGIVSIREYGWKTGWYRPESRILGVVRVLPIAEARKKDGF